MEFSHDSLFFESLSLLGSQHTTKFCFFPSFPNLLHLASGIVLGFPKALLSALFPVYSPLVIFAYYLMALNTAQTGFMQQVSQDAGKQTAGNRAELTMCFPPTSLSHGITKGESSRGSSLFLPGGGDEELLSVSTGISSLSPLSLFSEVPVPGQPHGSSGRNCLRSMHETEL